MSEHFKYFLIFALAVATVWGFTYAEKRYKELYKPPVIIKKIIKTGGELLIEQQNKKIEVENKSKADELTHETEILTYCSDGDYAFRQNYNQTELCIKNYTRAEKLVKDLRSKVNG